jgi:outer membrane lipopolysaccharide assembly protein LptE/RlpB
MRSPFAALAALLLLSACQMPLGGTSQRPAPVSGGQGGPTIELSSASASPGQTATITATLQTGGASIAGTQNDITFPGAQALRLSRVGFSDPGGKALGGAGVDGRITIGK